MEYRKLGASGLKVPALCLGTAGFGAKGRMFSSMGKADLDEARRLVDVCLEAGLNMFDTADVYSLGASESVLGEALKGRRDAALISTKFSLPMGRGANDWGSSRHRLIAGVDAALKRLQTDHIDILHIHAFDASTPAEEVVSTLDQLIRVGKVRYVGASNYPAWRLMKALAVADRLGASRFVAHQVHYSLIGRDYEWELMPLGLEEGVGALIWSPLGWGRLTGKIKRGQKPPEGNRLHDAAQYAPPVDEDLLYRVVDALEAVAAETGRSVSQVALAWTLSRPSVSSIVIGVRNEQQLRDNLGACEVKLTDAQIAALDAASDVAPCYPHGAYRVDAAFKLLNPPIV